MSETTFDDGHATTFAGNFTTGPGSPTPKKTLQLLPSVPDVRTFFDWIAAIGPSRSAPVLAVAAALGAAAALAGQAGALPPLQPDETADEMNSGGVIAGIESAGI